LEHKKVKEDLVRTTREKDSDAHELVALRSELKMVLGEAQRANEMRVQHASRAEDLQLELDTVLSQKGRLEAKMVLEKKSEGVLREEVASYKNQLEILQDDYEERHHLTGPTIESLKKSDRVEQHRLREQVQAVRRGRSSLSHSDSGKRRAPSSVHSASRPRSPALSSVEDEIKQAAREITETEKKLTEVSGLLERQLEKIRNQGEEPILLQAAKGTMAEGNELTVRLGQLNARKVKLEAERELLINTAGSSVSMDGRGDSVSVDRTATFDLIDKDGDGVIDRQEYEEWQWESAAKKDEDR